MFKIIGARSSCIEIHSHRILYSKPNQLKKKGRRERHSRLLIIIVIVIKKDLLYRVFEFSVCAG